MLWRMAGEPDPVGPNPFTDVPDPDGPNPAYYSKAAVWGFEEGVTTGVTPTTFGPFNQVTRGQVITMLWRLDGEPAPGIANPFTDVPNPNTPSARYFSAAAVWGYEV